MISKQNTEFLSGNYPDGFGTQILSEVGAAFCNTLQNGVQIFLRTFGSLAFCFIYFS